MKGAIFDIDGTVLDSMGVWYKATDKFFKSYGITLRFDEINAYQTMTLEESIPLIQKKYLPDIGIEKMFAQITDIVRAEYENSVPAKPGATEYIKQLHSDGVKIAVATSGIRDLCFTALKRLGIYDFIDVFAFSEETGHGKTDPDVYLLAARRLGLTPGECVVYEDILIGIESAARAGFKTVAIADPTNACDKERLARRSDKYITDWNELLRHIETDPFKSEDI